MGWSLPQVVSELETANALALKEASSDLEAAVISMKVVAELQHDTVLSEMLEQREATLTNESQQAVASAVFQVEKRMRTEIMYTAWAYVWISD